MRELNTNETIQISGGNVAVTAAIIYLGSGAAKRDAKRAIKAVYNFSASIVRPK